MAESGEFLVELGTEELPPKSLRTLANAFSDSVTALLATESLAFESIRSYATPRRLALRIDGLATIQPDRAVERRGPPTRIAIADDGLPTKAGQKFAQSVGTSFENLKRLETDKGEYLLYQGTDAGSPATEILPSVVERALSELPIARRMRWGASEFEFVRPVHWLVMLLDADVVPATLFGKTADRITHGHRFLASQPIHLNSARDYPGVLSDSGFVIADFKERKKAIISMIAELVEPTGGRAVYDESLLDEVTALVEWPVAIQGQFDSRFLDLPREVLISTLQSHQRYFPMASQGGGEAPDALVAQFITISNINSRDPAQVRKGNERVIRPRLDDAAFFWEKDSQRSLESRRSELSGIIFQHKLGSILDKSDRVEALAPLVAEAIGADKTATLRAAHLAKCDLATDMVGEFPDLQGTMGRYYALNDGESKATASAIEEHYLPRHAGDSLPACPEGQALAIADKVDTLASIFAIGQRPSGTRDPFGLRRGALGVLRILIEGELDLDLKKIVEDAANQVPQIEDPDLVSKNVFDYMMDRLRAYYTDGVGSIHAPVNVFEAVLARSPVSPLDFHRRMQAVLEFASLPAADSLAAANKRVANILDKTGRDDWEDADRDRLIEAEEKVLFESLTILSGEVRPLLAERKYRAALERLATLREPVDAFFDAVMVMDEDPHLRENRLALLNQMRKLFLHTADLSRLAT
ncbi:MAG: glycine--tRNA ligase subunit beta [Gammaproteobacteria bacterium]